MFFGKGFGFESKFGGSVCWLVVVCAVLAGVMSVEFGINAVEFGKNTVELELNIVVFAVDIVESGDTVGISFPVSIFISNISEYGTFKF